MAVRGVVAGARAVQESLLSGDGDGDDDGDDDDVGSGSDGDADDAGGERDEKRHSAAASNPASVPSAAAEPAAAPTEPRTRAATKAAAAAAVAIAAQKAERAAAATAQELVFKRAKEEVVQKQHNKDRLKDLSPAAQGRTLQALDRRYVLCAVYGCLSDGDQRGTAIRRVARWFSMAPDTVAAVMDAYDPECKGLDAPRAPPPSGVTPKTGRPGARIELTARQKELALDYIDKCSEDSKTCTVPDVAAHLSGADGAPVPALQTLRRRLYELGVRYLATARGPAQDLSGPDWVLRKSRYACAYASALTREAAANSDTVLVYADETFAHTGHARAHTLVNMAQRKQFVQPRRGKPKAVQRTGIGRGRLHIVVHACTRDGLLVGLDAGGAPVRPSEDHIGPVATAEKVWLSNKDTETTDYHAHYDGDMFINWVRTRLLPAFRSKYPSKRMILVVDNSATHRSMPDTFVRPSSASKRVIIDFLKARGVRGIWSTPAGGGARVYVRPEVWARNSPHGPSKAECVEALRDFYADHVNAQWCASRLEQVLLEESLRDHVPEMGCDPGSVHTVLFTVPYMSESQPIEKVWAVMKQHVAAQHKKGRSSAELRADILSGFYGSADGRHVGVTADACRRFIAHAKAEVDRWINADAVLRGLFPNGVQPSVDTLTAAIADAYTPRAGRMVIPLDADGDLLLHPAHDNAPELDPDVPDDAALQALINSTNAQYGVATAPPKPKRRAPKPRQTLQPPEKRQKTTPRRKAALPAPYD